ncbi:MAG: glucodextranase DOMON-like domain-containing protein [Halanaerobiales bacterium]
MKRIIVLFFLVLIPVIIFSPAGLANGEMELIFSVDDPAGDDHGPGTYEYPTHDVFAPREGIFDLQKFEIRRSEEYYYFSFLFGELNNPWEGRFDFSLPLIQLYIDNERGGEEELLQEGANVRLDPDHSWNKMLKISGWWIRLFTPEDRGEDFVSLSEEEIDSDYRIEDCSVTTEDNYIHIKLNRDYIGPLEHEYMYILVGGFDAFGYDHYRGVTGEVSSWQFYDPELESPESAPRVIDTVLPQGMSQEEVLADFEEDYPQISPVRLGFYGMPSSHKFIIIALMVAVAIIVALYIIYKRHLEYRIFG